MTGTLQLPINAGQSITNGHKTDTLLLLLKIVVVADILYWVIDTINKLDNQATFKQNELTINLNKLCNLK